jgi:hypothetical protein
MALPFLGERGSKVQRFWVQGLVNRRQMSEVRRQIKT